MLFSLVKMGLDVGSGSLEGRAHVNQIALADQVTQGDDDVWLSIVNIVILCLTILGAGMIITSMFILEYRGRPGTTRIRIVQALIFSDFLLGIVGLISSCLFLVGDGSLIAHGSASCSGLGFLLTAILWTEHGWTLILAIATYMILIYPLHWLTLWLEKRWYYLWAIVWVIAVAIATIGQTVFGYYPSGGTCFYGRNTGLYSELIQFIPRAVVCIVITFLYARLYVFLRRPDKIRIPGSNSNTGVTYETISSTSERSKNGDFRDRFGSMIPGQFWRRRGSSEETFANGEAGKPGVLIAQGQGDNDLKSIETPSRRGSKPSAAVPLKDLPPWERMELPPFQIGGERFGDRSPPPQSMWSGWKGMGGRKRSSTASGMTAQPNSMSASRMNSVSTSMTDHLPSANNPHRFTPPGLSAPRMPSIPSEDIPELASAIPGSSQRHRVDTNESLVPTLVAPTPVTSPLKTRRRPSKRLSIDPSIPLSPMSSLASSPEVSPKIERHRPSVTISEDLEYFDRTTPKSDSYHHQPNMLPPAISYSRSTSPSAPATPSAPDYDVSSSFDAINGRPGPAISPSVDPLTARPDWNNGRDDKGRSSIVNSLKGDEDRAEEYETDNDWDLMRMLAQPPPGELADDRFAPRPGNGERIEFVEESMASYLNRKTALLMLWFPLGYLFLFSVSLIRLIYDFAGKPPTALRAISKWMILAQGILDALIYGVVEWHTKRVVRKKIRRGTFSPRGAGTPSGSRMGASAAGFFKSVTSRVSAGAGGTNSRGGGGGSGSMVGGDGVGVESTVSNRRRNGNGTTSSLSVRGSQFDGVISPTASRRERGEVSFLEQVEEWGGSDHAHPGTEHVPVSTSRAGVDDDRGRTQTGGGDENGVVRKDMEDESHNDRSGSVNISGSENRNRSRNRDRLSTPTSTPTPTRSGTATPRRSIDDRMTGSGK